MAAASASGSGWLTPTLAGTATLGAVLASAGIAPAGTSALAALAAGATVVAALQSRQDRSRLRERLQDETSLLSSENRQLVDERDRLQHELERLDQLKAELVAAKQTAEAAVLAKGEFLATMSHEIRTPLNGIVPMLDLMARGPLDPTQQHLLLTATTSSHQLLRIVDDILDYSKLEANKLELECTAMNLQTLMQDLVSLLGSSAAKKQLETRLDIAPGVRLSVRGDPVRLRQVLGNLIANAIKFTDRGHIHLRLTSPGETATHHVLRFEVIDSGIGIEPDKLAHLFQPFSQADASTTRLYGGTGLGLAICRRIVDLMEGRIGVLSTPGQGSTFWFEVPMLKAIGDMPFQIAPPAPVPGMLVCADDGLAERLQRLALRWALRLHHVPTAHDALDHLRLAEAADRPQLVIADVDSLRQTVQALHRAVTHAVPMPRLVWLTGKAPLSPALAAQAHTVSREAGDGELRHAIAPLVILPPAVSGQRPVADTPDLPLPDAPAPVEENAPDLTGMRVLLVEDNPVNRLVAQHLLDSLGVIVTIAENGQQALELMPRTHIDAVLMDCQMPVLDGYQATAQWRSLEVSQKRTPLPIIAMTANAMGGDRQRCLDAGMDDYLSKPVDRIALRECLARLRSTVQTDLAAVTAPLAATDDDTLPAPAASGSDLSALDLGMPLAEPSETAAPAALAAPAPAPVNSPPPLDMTVLDELFQLIGAHTGEIITAYLADAPILLEQMQQAATDHDIAALREAAHSLKSASANVGARGLSTIALRIENAAREGQLDRPDAQVGLLVAEFARIRIGLRAWLSRMPNDKEPVRQP